MLITAVSNNFCNKKNTYTNSKQISFGQIKPEHLFVNIDSFEKDTAWANKMIEVINESKEKIAKGSKFQGVLKYITTNYHDYYLLKELAEDFQDIPYGLMREGKQRINVIISPKGSKYSSYYQKVLGFIQKQPLKKDTASIYSIDLNALGYSFRQKTHNKIKKIDLSSLKISIEELPKELKNKLGDNIISCESPPAETLSTVFKHIKHLYKDLVKIKNVKNEKKLDYCNKKIAEMHWFFAQSTPYIRGSAGIADVLTKSLYESLGIQVSPWRKGIAPDLEAISSTLEDYIKNYPTLFEKPPEIMQK